MGEVYLVRSISTGSQFALKRAKYKNAGDRKAFLAELQTWIDLPDHPNLVACRFFRTLCEEVLIFAEYVKGGSLKDWIDSRKLYEGGPDQALERMLDIAIQLAWGLHCVHEMGAIHQDVKPSNVLMASDGVAGVHGVKPKVTDFGLARARAAAGEDFDPGSSIIVSSIRGTPAYWSPEQAQGMPITHKADIWSWGLSVMEMFTGGLTWMSGLGAAEVLQQYLLDGEYDAEIPLMPNDLADLLSECFSHDPLERPASLANTVDKIQKIYQDHIGSEYHRTLETIGKSFASQDGIKERKTRTGAVWMDPKVWREEALKAAGRNSGDSASVVAGNGATRPGILVADIAIYDEAKGIFEELIRCGQNNLKPHLAKLCINKALVHQTAGDVHGSIMEYNRAIDLLKESTEESEDLELAIRLVHAYVRKAHVLNDYTADHLSAFDSYKRATDALEILVNNHGRTDLESSLSSFYSNMAGSSELLGNSKEAVEIYDKALAIKEKLVNQNGRMDLAGDLARTYMNKSTAISSLGDNNGASALCDHAILILEQLITLENRSDLENDLAHVYTNKASYVSVLGDKSEAIILYDKAIAIRERWAHQEGRKELVDDLAWVYELKAHVANDLGDKPGAVSLYDKAIAIQEKMVNQEGRKELANSLAVTYANKALFCKNLGNVAEALALYDKAISIQERLIYNEGRSQLLNNLACTFSNKADAAKDMNDHRGALALYDRAIAIREKLVNEDGRNDLANDLATDYEIKAEVASELCEYNVALEAYNNSRSIRERLVIHDDRSEPASDLAKAYCNTGVLLDALGEGCEALAMYEKAMAIQERLVNQHGLSEILGDLARSKGGHGMMLLNHGEVEQVEQALVEVVFALNTLQAEFQRTGRIDLKSTLEWLEYSVSEFMHGER